MHSGVFARAQKDETEHRYHAAGPVGTLGKVMVVKSYVTE